MNLLEMNSGSRALIGDRFYAYARRSGPSPRRPGTSGCRSSRPWRPTTPRPWPSTGAWASGSSRTTWCSSRSERAERLPLAGVWVDQLIITKSSPSAFLHDLSANRSCFLKYTITENMPQSWNEPSKMIFTANFHSF